MRHGYSKELTYERNKLLQVISKNRVQHVEDYNLAVKEYREQLVKRLNKLLKKAEYEKRHPAETNLETYHIDLEVPVCYVKDYDRAIAQFDMTTEQIIKLNSVEFSQLVLDEWDWKAHFDSNTMSYANAAKIRL